VVGAGPSRGEVTDASERSWLAEHTLPADQRWALLRRCLTNAQLSTPLRVAGSLVLLYGQTPTRIVTLTQHDVTRLDGMTYLTLHRQPVLMPTRLADLGRPARRVQHRAPATARIRQSRSTLAIPRRTTWRTPTSRISRHVAQ